MVDDHGAIRPSGARQELLNLRQQGLLVVRRPGTISPWSSKATDIAHVCGLTAVRRIERGIAFDTRHDLDSWTYYLIGRQVAAERFNTQGWGPDQPIADNQTAQGRAKNRRVEIFVADR